MVITTSAEAALERRGQLSIIQTMVNRHALGDWGDLDAEDIETNNQALIHGNRLLSAYEFEDGFNVWLITEADRSATTILLPEDY